MYAGLLSFLALIVWDVAGAHAALLAAPEKRPRQAPRTRHFDFQPPNNRAQLWGLPESRLVGELWAGERE